MDKGNKGTSATRAKTKYNKANYDEIRLYVPKGRKDVYKTIADTSEESLNSFITKATEEKIERESLLEEV